MKKASKILLIINGVLAILAAIGFLVTGVIFMYGATPEAREMILKLIDEGAITTSTTMTREELATFVQTMSSSLGIGFVISAVLNIPNAVLSLIAAGKEKKPLYIIVIVLSVLSSTLVGILGGIFGLISSSKE